MASRTPYDAAEAVLYIPKYGWVEVSVLGYTINHDPFTPGRALTIEGVMWDGPPYATLGDLVDDRKQRRSDAVDASGAGSSLSSGSVPFERDFTEDTAGDREVESRAWRRIAVCEGPDGEDLRGLD